MLLSLSKRRTVGSTLYCTQAGIPMEKMPGARSSGTLRERFKTDVQPYAPYSYDAAMALIEAMKNAGSAEPGKYLPALQKLDYKGVTGNIAFDQYGDVKEAGVTSTSSRTAAGSHSTEHPPFRRAQRKCVRPNVDVTGPPGALFLLEGRARVASTVFALIDRGYPQSAMDCALHQQAIAKRTAFQAT